MMCLTVDDRLGFVRVSSHAIRSNAMRSEVHA
jgi:hypothetical protein